MSSDFCWKKKRLDVKVWRRAALGSSLAVEFLQRWGRTLLNI